MGTARTSNGPEEIVELFKGWKQAFPDAVGTVTSAIASGDTAALEVTWNGTHTGPLATADGTIAASSKHQETPAAFFFTFAGDKVKESRHYFDSLTLLKQIGSLITVSWPASRARQASTTVASASSTLRQQILYYRRGRQSRRYERRHSRWSHGTRGRRVQSMA